MTFDASAASDPDGPLARYDWDLDGDGTFETSTGQTPTVARAYGAEAEISVGLRVTDAQGSSDERGDVLVVGDFAQEEQRLAAEEEEEAAAGARGGAPILSGLRVRPRRLRAALRGGSVTARRGARVRYRLSERASVRFTLRRRTLTQRGCPRGSRTRPCARYRPVGGAVVHRGRPGANAFRLSGRLRGRRLRQGRYLLVARATDPAGSVSR